MNEINESQKTKKGHETIEPGDDFRNLIDYISNI